MPHPIEKLSSLPDMPQAVIDSVKQLMEEEHIRKGTTFHGTHFTDSHGVYIKRGAARIFYTERGREHTMAFAFDDDMLFIKRPNGMPAEIPMTVTFLEDSEVVTFNRADMKLTIMSGYTQGHPMEAMFFLNSIMAQYASYLEECIYHLTRSSARERYEWAIRRYPRLTQVATTTQIASFLGLTKETLYRIRSGKYPTAN